MYITSVLSYLGAWKSLQSEYPLEYQQIDNVINQATTVYRTIQKARVSQKGSYSPARIQYVPRTIFKEEFLKHGWMVNNRLYIREYPKRRYSEMDAIKNGIGVEYGFSKFAFIEDHLLVKIPLFIIAQRIKIGLVLTFTEQFVEKHHVSTSSFEMVRDRFVTLSPLFKYPFAVIGLSEKPQELIIDELTTELDQFLVRKTGYSLLDMAVQNEAENYDFKQQLPANKKIAQEACAFANIPGGGLILVGIDNNGSAVGIPRAEVDDTKSKVSQVVGSSCFPPPKIEYYVFDAPSSKDNCVLIIEIFELERKPCMLAESKVIYVRDGSSAIPAGPEHVRKIILGRGN